MTDPIESIFYKDRSISLKDTKEAEETITKISEAFNKILDGKNL